MNNTEFVFKEASRPLFKMTFRNGNKLELVEPDLKTVEAIKKRFGTSVESEKATESELYAFAAQVMSENLQHKRITPRQLKRKYKLSLGDVVDFVVAYTGYIRSIEESKN